MRTYKVSQSYNGEIYAVENVPEWLSRKIESAMPGLHPTKPVTLVVGDTPSAILEFGSAPRCNKGYIVQID